MQPLAIYLSATGNSSHAAFSLESRVANDDISGRGMKRRKLDSSTQDAAFYVGSLSPSFSETKIQQNTGPKHSIIGDAENLVPVNRRRKLKDVSVRETNLVGLLIQGNTLPNQSTSIYAPSDPVSNIHSKMRGIVNESLADAIMLHQQTSAMWSKNGWLARARLAARRKALLKQPRSASYARLFMLQQKILSEMMANAWHEDEHGARQN